jgi:hypothetical protein
VAGAPVVFVELSLTKNHEDRIKPGHILENTVWDAHINLQTLMARAALPLQGSTTGNNRCQTVL